MSNGWVCPSWAAPVCLVILAADLSFSFPAAASSAAALFSKAANESTVTAHMAREGERKMVSIGGRVQDGSGQAIAGASVTIYGLVRDEVGQSIEVEYESVTTDSSGIWSSAKIPAEFQSLEFKLRHAEFLPAEFDLLPEGRLGGLSRATLIGRKAVCVMEPGIRVEGTVVEGNHQPVAGARVYLFSDTERPIKLTRQTDNSGHFQIVMLQTGSFHLVIQAAGYAPTYLPVNVEIGLKPFRLVLSKGVVLKGRVIDSEQKPLPGVSIEAASWNGRALLDWRTKTDDSGRFSWDSAPADAVLYLIANEGYVSIVNCELIAGGEEIILRLEKAFLLAGKVVDAETQQPLPEFTLIRGRSFTPGNPPAWERYNPVRGTRGAYTLRLPRQDELSLNGSSFMVMIEAPGYWPAVSREFPLVGWHTNDFALKKGNGPKGVVQLPNGDPADGAEVALLTGDYIALEKARFGRRSSSMDRLVVKTDAQGQFALPAALASLIVAVHEKGYGEMTPDGLSSTPRMILQPWGTIEGILRVGNHLGTNQLVALSSPTTGRSLLDFDLKSFQAPTDAQGRFVLSNVPPGERMLFRLQSVPSRGLALSSGLPVTVKPGEVIHITYGGIGRPIMGKLVASDPQAKVDWQSGYHSFTTLAPRPPPNLRTPEEVRAWNNTSAVKQALRNYRTYVVEVAADGTFRMEDVPAGVYTLNLRLTEPAEDQRRPGPGNIIASLSREVVVPEMPGGRSDEPLDLGTLTLPLTLHVGDAAPLFEAKTLDGQLIKLENYQGKFVLLDFWASWVGPRTTDLPVLTAVYEAHKNDDRFMMVGLNFDPQAEAAQEYLKKMAIKWRQGFLGDWSSSPLPAAYGLDGIPATVLVGPEGKILGLNLRGQGIRSTVERAMNPSRGM